MSSFLWPNDCAKPQLVVTLGRLPWRKDRLGLIPQRIPYSYTIIYTYINIFIHKNKYTYIQYIIISKYFLIYIYVHVCIYCLTSVQNYKTVHIQICVDRSSSVESDPFSIFGFWAVSEATRYHSVSGNPNMRKNKKKRTGEINHYIIIKKMLCKCLWVWNTMIYLNLSVMMISYKGINSVIILWRPTA